MPELPEVETIRMQLEAAVVGKIVADIVSLHPKTVSGDIHHIRGRKIKAVRRIGKMLSIDLDPEYHIGIHLKMSGQLLYRNNHKDNELPDKHIRAIIEFSDSSALYFNDQRIFGWIKIVSSAELSGMKYIKNLGPEPWNISDADFFRLVRSKKKAIKLVILDQEAISGVGNIYANDSLWEAKINPERISRSLFQKESTALKESIIKILKEAIRFRGSSGKDQKYVHIDGASGRYQDRFRVYEREGKRCLRDDGGVVKKTAIGGRGTYYCPKCQK